MFHIWSCSVGEAEKLWCLQTATMLTDCSGLNWNERNWFTTWVCLKMSDLSRLIIPIIHISVLILQFGAQTQIRLFKQSKFDSPNTSGWENTTAGKQIIFKQWEQSITSSRWVRNMQFLALYVQPWAVFGLETGLVSYVKCLNNLFYNWCWASESLPTCNMLGRPQLSGFCWLHSDWFLPHILMYTFLSSRFHQSNQKHTITCDWLWNFSFCHPHVFSLCTHSYTDSAVVTDKD